MSPQSFQLKDGRIINIANYPAVNNSSEIWKDPITGKIFLAGSVEVEVDIDTSVFPYSPGNNFSTDIYITMGAYGFWLSRSLLVVPKNKICNVCTVDSFSPSGIVKVYEIDPSLFTIQTVTWTNQPSIGNLITTFNSPTTAGQWITFPTGNSGAILIKFQDEGVPPYAVRFYSWNYTDPTKRPYITDP